MREIKFRVFNTDLNKMIYPDETGWFQSAYLSSKTGVIQHTQLGFIVSGRQKELVPMQYTGLKDKNGKEIYEGDVVTSEEYPFMDEGEFNYHAVIEWVDETAAFIRVFRLVNPNKRGISDGIAELIDNPDELIVIGNIYESEDNQ